MINELTMAVVDNILATEQDEESKGLLKAAVGCGLAYLWRESEEITGATLRIPYFSIDVQRTLKITDREQDKAFNAVIASHKSRRVKRYLMQERDAGRIWFYYSTDGKPRLELVFPADMDAIAEGAEMRLVGGRMVRAC